MSTGGLAYHYRLYDLVFASEIPLPFDACERAPADVTVRVGQVPENLGEGEAGRGFWTARDGQFLMNHALTGSALVRGGNEVIVGPDAPDMLRVFLTGSVLTTLLQQRGLLTFHASAVERGGKVIAMLGKSGVGKSTTAYALTRLGNRFVSDDVVALKHDPASGRFRVLPSLPRAALWRDALDRMNMPVGKMRHSFTGVEKYFAPVENPASGEMWLDRLVFLEPHMRGEATAEPLDQQEVFMRLALNIHRKRAAQAMGAWPAMFKQFKQICDNVPAALVQRPREGDSVDRVASAILSLASATQPG